MGGAARIGTGTVQLSCRKRRRRVSKGGPADDCRLRVPRPRFPAHRL